MDTVLVTHTKNNVESLNLLLQTCVAPIQYGKRENELKKYISMGIILRKVNEDAFNYKL